MKKLLIVLTVSLFTTGMFSCGNTRETREADPKAPENKPMRHREQVEDNPTPGHQNDQIRENNRPED